MSSETTPTATRRPALGVAELIAFVASLTALNALAIDMMLPALGDIGASLGVARANDTQLVILVYIFSSGVAQLFYGPLADRFGRRIVLLAALGGYALAASLAIVATSFTMLLVARMLQGVTTAAGRVVGIAVVRDMSSGRRMAEIMSTAMTIFMIVPIIAPGVGQAIMLATPWRGLFVVLAVFGVVMWVWTWLRLPETLPPERRTPLKFGTVSRAFAAVLRNRIAFGYTLASMCMFAAPMAYLSSADQIFMRTFDLGALFPVVFGCVAISLAAASLTNARLVGRFGMRLISHLAALVFLAVNLVHVIVAVAGFETLATFVVLQMIAFFGVGLMIGNFSALALEPLGHIAGVASSALGFATMSGSALIGGLIARFYDGTTAPLAIGFACTAVAVVVILLVTERGRLMRPGAEHADG